MIVKDWAVNGTYPTHSEVTMFFTVNGVETKEADIKPKAKPGWIIWDNDYPWYCGSKGEQSLYYKLNTGRSYFMDGSIHVDGCSMQQDAYGIKFDNNSGSGTMNNQMISNIADDNNRKLSKCTFTHENYHFIGWAKNPNAEKPDFTDEAVVPTHMTGINKMITLYAIWEKD